MTYEEVKGWFECSSWKKAALPSYDCYFSDSSLCIFFYHEEKKIIATISGREASSVADIPLDPSMAVVFGGDCFRFSFPGGGGLQMWLPRDSERIEREKEKRKRKRSGRAK